MPAQKIAKKLPKRVGNDKLKVRRNKSWLANQKAKDGRKKENDKRHANNVKTGCTGKMRLYNPLHSVLCVDKTHVTKDDITNR